MRSVTAAILASLAIASSVHAQTLLPKNAVQHAAVTASASAASAAPGQALTLWADVVPNRSIHIYAEGAKDFTPVTLVVAQAPGVSEGKPKYPKAEMTAAPGTADAVPAYTQRFRIALPVTVAPKARHGDVITVSGAVNYQACDDRLCYPVTSAPVTWNIAVD